MTESREPGFRRWLIDLLREQDWRFVATVVLVFALFFGCIGAVETWGPCMDSKERCDRMEREP